MERNTSSRRRSPAAVIVTVLLYLLPVILVCAALFCIRQPLLDRLNDHEAQQLENRLDRVFAAHFAQPDWTTLYTLAGIEDTPFEGSAEFAAYMASRVHAPLTYREVDTDLPRTHRYQLLCGDDVVGAFTMVQNPQWSLGTVEFFFTRNQWVTVEKTPGSTVYLNGMALDDRFTIRTTETVAEAYLPEGIHGSRKVVQHAEGFLLPPRVTVIDADGQAVPITQQPGTNHYTLPETPPAELTEAEKLTVREAAIADAKYSIGNITPTQLKQYFDETSPVYAMIVGNPLNLQKHTSSSIDPEAVQISEYCRYSDQLFSARVQLTLNIIRKDGTLKVYKLDKTYFFTKRSDGRYLVSDYTNESVTRTIEQVRLTFVVGDPVSQMVSADAEYITPPPLETPNGAVLLGWATHTTDEDGNTTAQIRILPDGTILGDLAPMELHPVFDAP